MFYIGNHLSASKGFAAMGRKEVELGGNTFAFLLEIQEEEKQKQSMKRILKSSLHMQKNTILEN